MKTRFAPAPTGRLHVGNIRTALHNYLLARREGGTFLLRIDDTDTERSKAEYVEKIREDLGWLGLTADEEARQSERFDLYEAAFERLREAGRIYACYETPEELDLRRKVLAGRGLPPIYERKDSAEPPPEGRSPHWRFKLEHDASIEWTDLVRGPQKFDPKLISDPVVRREDGSWLYMLPSVVDDIDLSITHIVRGEDHVTNSAIQLQMFDALGAGRPQLAHEALLVAAEGKLSKRLGSVGVEAMQERGLEPMALLSLLARIGTSQPVEPVRNLAHLASGLDFRHFGRAPAQFSFDEVALLNAKLLHETEYAAVADRLSEEIGEAEWNALRGNLETLRDVEPWVDILHGDIDPPAIDPEDRDYLHAAARIAGLITFDADAWTSLTSALKEETGRKGRALFMPLRLALTGQTSGPEMAALLPIIGQKKAIKRLQIP
ncbi:glutamate--tRNA ligase [Sphingomicrobium marinum]|uniref:glutamate--tRNA ligase n=1 Tax=Sphingomicrobium marinum TaxID=1227950 RepID=UPI00224039E1|nr:glutamate--tRNA ligase [Sphingomicrobium marinum]